MQGIAVATDAGERTVALSVGNDRTVHYWDVATGQDIHRFAHDGAVFAGEFAPPDHRRTLSAGLDGTLRLWDLGNGTEIARFPGHKMPVYSVAFSADGLQPVGERRWHHPPVECRDHPRDRPAQA